MHDHLGEEAKKEEANEANGEAEAGPVVAVLEGLKSIALEVNLTVKIHLVERLHCDLGLATVLEAIGLVLEVQVVLNTTVGEASLLSFAGADRRDNEPEGSKKGKIDKDSKEDEGLQATTDLPFEVVWNADQEGDQESVAERVGAGAIRRERSIGDRGRLRSGGLAGMIAGMRVRNCEKRHSLSPWIDTNSGNINQGGQPRRREHVGCAFMQYSNIPW